MNKHILIGVFLVMQGLLAYSQQMERCDLLRRILSDSTVVHELLFNKEGMNPLIIKQTKRSVENCIQIDTLGRLIKYQTMGVDSFYAEARKDRKENCSVLYISELEDIKNGEKKVSVADPCANAVVDLYFKLKKGKLLFIRSVLGPM